MNNKSRDWSQGKIDLILPPRREISLNLSSLSISHNNPKLDLFGPSFFPPQPQYLILESLWQNSFSTPSILNSPSFFFADPIPFHACDMTDLVLFLLQQSSVNKSRYIRFVLRVLQPTVQINYNRQMGKQVLEDSDQSGQTARAGKRIVKRTPKLTGRPKRSPMETVHEEHFAPVKEINETIAFITKKFSMLQNYLNRNENLFYEECDFSPLFSKDFKQKEMTQPQRLKYGSKSTLLYWLHYIVTETGRAEWYPHELLALVLLWFSSQNVLPEAVFQQSKKWIHDGVFAKELFDNKVVRNYDQINLLVILVIDIAAFEDLSIVEKAVLPDVQKEIDQMFTEIELEVHNLLMG